MTKEDKSEDQRLNTLLEELRPRLKTTKEQLVKEIEHSLSELLGVDVKRIFKAVADAQQIHTSPSLNLDRAHKSGLLLLAHVLAESRIAPTREPGG